MTHRLRGTCRPTPRRCSPCPDAPTSPAPVPARAVQAARCLSALRGTPCLLQGRGRSSLPDPRACGGGFGQTVFTLRAAGTRGAWGVAAPGGQPRGDALCGGKTSPPRLPSLFLSAVSPDPCGARRPLPTGRVTAAVGTVCCGFAQLPLQRLRSRRSRTSVRCAPGRPRPRGLCGRRRALQRGVPAEGATP